MKDGATRLAVDAVEVSRLSKCIVTSEASNARVAHNFCDSSCAAQAQLPELSNTELDDVAAFAATRNRVTLLRECQMKTIHAIQAVRDAAQTPVEELWCDTYSYGYHHGGAKEKIYSIQFYKDPSARDWLSCMEVDLALHQWAQALFNFMVMGLRTNHVMAQALRDELRIHKRLPPEDIKAILERPGIMASATRMGNDEEETTRTHIIDLYNAVVASDRLEDIRDSWQKILNCGLSLATPLLVLSEWRSYIL